MSGALVAEGLAGCRETRSEMAHLVLMWNGASGGVPRGSGAEHASDSWEPGGQHGVVGGTSRRRGNGPAALRAMRHGDDGHLGPRWGEGTAWNRSCRSRGTAWPGEGSAGHSACRRTAAGSETPTGAHASRRRAASGWPTGRRMAACGIGCPSVVGASCGPLWTPASAASESGLRRASGVQACRTRWHPRSPKDACAAVRATEAGRAGWERRSWTHRTRAG